jgi:DNA-binding MarR family transcriptional regulator
MEEDTYYIDRQLYTKINEIPGSSESELAKALNWDLRKVSYSIKRLERDGLISVEGSLITPVPWYELLTPEDLEEFMSMEVEE